MPVCIHSNGGAVFLEGPWKSAKGRQRALRSICGVALSSLQMCGFLSPEVVGIRKGWWVKGWSLGCHRPSCKVAPLSLTSIASCIAHSLTPALSDRFFPVLLEASLPRQAMPPRSFKNAQSHSLPGCHPSCCCYFQLICASL